MYTKYVELRDLNNLTDAKISEATGIPKSTFSDWKQGRSKPKLEKLFKIAQFFNVPIETFVNREGD